MEDRNMATSDYVTTERVGVVVWLLAAGRAMSTAEVADMTGTTRNGAWRLLSKLCRVLPLYLDDDGIWRRMEG